MAVSLTHLNEFCLGFWVARIGTRMILNCQFSVSFLYLSKRGCSWNTQHLVIIKSSFWEMLLEESSFPFTFKTMIIKKLLECLISVLYWEVSLLNLIVMMSALNIWQCCVCLVNLVENFLCLDSILWVFLRVPFGWQPSVGSLDVILCAIFIKTENIIVVIEILLTWCWFCLVWGVASRDARVTALLCRLCSCWIGRLHFTNLEI